MPARMNTHLIWIILLFTTALAVAQPPEPPVGQRWILNEKFSDEFNGTELDRTKWNDYYPGWTGREPGIFLPSQIKVENGYMSIRGEKLARDTVITNWDGSKSIYNIAGGAVTSKSLDAWFGYYECRFKAAATTMSTTFWMSTRGNSPGPEPCNDSYGLELDIQECIGREGDFSGSYFAKGMHSNSHFWYKDCAGVNNDYRAVSVNFDSDELASAGFNTYGGWWRDESTATYYYNNKEAKSHQFYSAVKEKPFDRTMGVNLVSETYPFPWISLPSDEELADSSKNICYYDWVRAYVLTGVDEPLSVSDNLIHNGDFETGDFAYWGGWGGNPREVVDEGAYEGTHAAFIAGPGAPEYTANLRAYSTYSLSCYAKVVDGSGPLYFGIKDPNETVLGSVQVTETAYTRKSFQFTTGSSGGRLKLYFYAPGEGDAGYADNFKLVQLDADDSPAETVMFDEKLKILEPGMDKTSRLSLDFLLSYMANADREINLFLYNPGGTLVGEQKFLALAGFGKKEYRLQLDSLLSPGNAYELLADIRPIDSTAADTFFTARYAFNLLDPVDVELRVLDLRDEAPISGARVTIQDSAKFTDQKGKVKFFRVSPGKMPVSIEREGYLDYSSGDISLESDTGLILHMTPVSHMLRFYITNSHTGSPLAEARVDVDGKELESDHNGMANVLIFEGAYTASVSLDRYAEKAISLLVGKDTLIRIELDQILAHAKFVVKRDNSSLSGASVTLGGVTETTSPIGMASFSNLRTDSIYTYRIEYQSELLEEESVIFLADTTLRLNFASTDFKIPGEDGSPILYPNPAGEFIVVSGTKGEIERITLYNLQGIICAEFTQPGDQIYDLRKLAGGSYLLKAEGDGFCEVSIFVKY